MWLRHLVALDTRPEGRTPRLPAGQSQPWPRQRCSARRCRSVPAGRAGGPNLGKQCLNLRPCGKWPRGGAAVLASSYFYPRPPYGGRPEDGAPVAVIDEISIHVPRMGGRPATPCGILSSLYFYPRPPYGGRPSTFRQYLSRCPNFYPRPPYGGRPSCFGIVPISLTISIHVPRMGDDVGQLSTSSPMSISIHVPRMGDDARRGRGLALQPISIHVPRMGDDAA